MAAASRKVASDARFVAMVGLFNGALLRKPDSWGRFRASYFEP